MALRGASAADFDKAYVADQGENHSNALTLYGDYMLWGEYEKLHALAIKMIPITEADKCQGRPGSRRRLRAMASWQPASKKGAGLDVWPALRSA